MARNVGRGEGKGMLQRYLKDNWETVASTEAI